MADLKTREEPPVAAPAEPDPPPPVRRPPSRWAAAMLALGIALAGLVALDVTLLVDGHDPAAGQRAPALAAARQAAVELGQIGLEGSGAQVRAAGLERLDAERAVALVAVVATVPAPDQDPGQPGGQERRYRLAVELERADGRWQASSVALVP
ncbi:MAG: hypothetical protein ACT4RN_18625 [Pseudonocardia sp.]